jgi:hypothetical protein
MKREEDEPLWGLLGHSSVPKVSPFFARNVVRKIRQERPGTAPSRWWQARWFVPTTAFAAALIAAFSLHTQMPRHAPVQSDGDTISLVDPQDGDLMADIDDLMDSDDSPTLEDSVLL